MLTRPDERTMTVDLSIVTTMYSSSSYLDEFYSLATRAVLARGQSYEIVFVNDGSPDDSLMKAVSLADADPNVRVIDLSRNFGHHRAIMVGLEHARGERIFLIDCDLEEDPLLLPTFLEEMGRAEADVVYGVQKSRRGGLIRRIGGGLFWHLFNALADIQITPNVVTSRVMTRRYVDAVLLFRERELFLDGIFELAGFKQVSITVPKGFRSNSSYTFRKRLSLLTNAVTSFSSKPLTLVFYLGVVISLLGFGAASFLVLRVLLYGDYLTGWASLIVSIWVLSGIVIFCLGLIGIYLAKIFQEVKERPLSIVREIYQRPPREQVEMASGIALQTLERASGPRDRQPG